MPERKSHSVSFVGLTGTLWRVADNALWLRTQLGALTDHNEESFPDPWPVSDAPADHIEGIMTAIVGVEVVITKMLGKWKISQNQPAKNQAGVISGLRASSLPESGAMAALVESVAKNAR